jgi:DNA-binding NarL/FixJ family response regulator
MLNCPTTNDLNLLSTRERQVALVAQGLTNRQIAEKNAISETVKNNLRAVFEKPHVEGRLELAIYALHDGLWLELIGVQLVGRPEANPRGMAK